MVSFIAFCKHPYLIKFFHTTEQLRVKRLAQGPSGGSSAALGFELTFCSEVLTAELPLPTVQTEIMCLSGYGCVNGPIVVCYLLCFPINLLAFT